MAEIKRVLMTTENRGKGIIEDPIRNVNEFYDEETLRRIGEIDPCEVQVRADLIEGLLMLKKVSDPPQGTKNYIDHILHKHGKRDTTWNSMCGASDQQKELECKEAVGYKQANAIKQ